ncbi:hypothetical protein LMG32289_03864 [Cupriavidus pampae]|uniref:HTH cro/C1-type domain-containing protein n=2 Tax=Cupriavidus pampae TaxID=659251 RepID=A0ABN7YVX4_9BURK|nr:hypothetical protein LMG32289_03864 [Cupriavidus pampae]
MQTRKVKSQSALARMTGVPQPTINRILKGQTDTPELGTIKKIAAALNVSATWLAEGPGDVPPELDLDPMKSSADFLALASQSIEERVRSTQLEATQALIKTLPSAVLSQLLGALQDAKARGDYTLFQPRVMHNSETTASGERGKVISGGEPDPVPQSNKRVKTR